MAACPTSPGRPARRNVQNLMADQFRGAASAWRGARCARSGWCGHFMGTTGCMRMRCMSSRSRSRPTRDGRRTRLLCWSVCLFCWSIPSRVVRGAGWALKSKGRAEGAPPGACPPVDAFGQQVYVNLLMISVNRWTRPWERPPLCALVRENHVSSTIHEADGRSRGPFHAHLASRGFGARPRCCVLLKGRHLVARAIHRADGRCGQRVTRAEGGAHSIRTLVSRVSRLRSTTSMPCASPRQTSRRPSHPPGRRPLRAAGRAGPFLRTSRLEASEHDLDGLRFLKADISSPEPSIGPTAAANSDSCGQPVARVHSCAPSRLEASEYDLDALRFPKADVSSPGPSTVPTAAADSHSCAQPVRAG